MDALFLTVSTGSGHIKAAEAVKECIEDRFQNSRTLIIDTLKYVSPLADRLIVGGYLQTVKRIPKIYGKLYNMAELNENLTDFCKNINRLFSDKLCSIIDDFQPSVIVCTHTVPVHMLSYLKKKGTVSVPVIAVVTDYTNHLFWKHDNIDAYIAAHDCIKRDMVSMGIREESIYTYGIPVSGKFLQKKDRKRILEELKLKDKLTVLLMGGSLGLGEVPEVFQSLLNCKRNLQIIAITGNNSRLKSKLESYCLNTDKEVRILGYTDRVADYMDASDLIITKPGGMTVSEALVKELPILIMSPIPGQEERNAHFLVNSGAAARILPGDDIDSILCQILDNPLRMKQMKEMARCIARPNAGGDIANLLEKLTLKKSAESFQCQLSIYI